jgi:hypothetical protein
MDINKEEYLKIINLLWFFIIFFINQIINFVSYIILNKDKYQQSKNWYWNNYYQYDSKLIIH